jgi:hypothetical protein
MHFIYNGSKSAVFRTGCLQEKRHLIVSFLCLSGACLGKSSDLVFKWHRKNQISLIEKDGVFPGH